jgi:hypothetical protein
MFGDIGEAHDGKDVGAFSTLRLEAGSGFAGNQLRS